MPLISRRVSAVTTRFFCSDHSLPQLLYPRRRFHAHCILSHLVLPSDNSTPVVTSLDVSSPSKCPNFQSCSDESPLHSLVPHAALFSGHWRSTSPPLQLVSTPLILSYIIFTTIPLLQHEGTTTLNQCPQPLLHPSFQIPTWSTLPALSLTSPRLCCTSQAQQSVSASLGDREASSAAPTRICQASLLLPLSSSDDMGFYVATVSPCDVR